MSRRAATSLPRIAGGDLAAEAPQTPEQLRQLLLADTPEARSQIEALLGRDNSKPSARDELAKLTQTREGLVAEMDTIVETAATETRDFTAEEAEKRGNLTARIDQLDAQITEREDAIRQDEVQSRKKEMQEAVAQMRREMGLSERVDANGWVDVGDGAYMRENRTYERGNGTSYLKDLVIRTMGPGMGGAFSQACERLHRHGIENHHVALDVESRAVSSDHEAGRSQAEEYFRRQMIEQFADREHNTRGASGFGVAPGLLSYRALSTASTAGGEFVPPMFLTEQWIEFLRAARVFANTQHHEDLPDGTMSLNIPKVVTGTSVNVQGTQNTNISDTDITTQFVTVPVVTFAGQQVVSLQLLERSPIQFDEVIMKDLAKAHAQRVDIQCLNGKGETGEVTGVLNTSGIVTVTWTQASPKIKGLYGQLGLAKVDIYEGTATTPGLFMPATHCHMSGNCWEWIGQSFDTTERPLVVPEYNGPFNVVQVAPDEMTAEEAVGRNLSGLRTFEDANIPSELGVGKNQDVAIVSRADENYLYESPIVTRALPQTYGAQLSVLLQLYNYGAYTCSRYPNANAVLTGTGMSRANRTFNS
jgi:hypothetical protein